MKKLLLVLLLLLIALPADSRRLRAQCNGAFPPLTACGNGSPSTAAPAGIVPLGAFNQIAIGTTTVNPTTPNGGLLYNSSGFVQDNGPLVSSVSNPTGNGQWSVGATNSLGAILIGQGTTNDLTLENSAGTTVLAVPTGTGHMSVGSGTPTNNACTGFALSTGSNDLIGRVTFTSATSCVINFSHAFVNAPFCTVSPNSAASTSQVTTTTTALTATFGTAQTSMIYQCFGT